MDRGTCWATVHGVTESDTTEGLTENRTVMLYQLYCGKRAVLWLINKYLKIMC